MNPLTDGWYILDAENRVVKTTPQESCRFLQDGNRTVGYTEITSQITVITSFICMDHRILGRGPPVVFETLVFGGPTDGDGERYCTWDEAEIGHREYVAKARAAIGQRISMEETP